MDRTLLLQVVEVFIVVNSCLHNIHLVCTRLQTGPRISQEHKLASSLSPP